MSYLALLARLADLFRRWVRAALPATRRMPPPIGLECLESRDVPAAPVAWGDSLHVVHDRVLTATAGTGLLVHGYDPDNDTLTATITSGPAHGTLTTATDGAFAYQADTGRVGVDNFRFVLSDGTSSSDEATINLDVTNSAPYAYNTAFTVAHDHALTESMWYALSRQGYDMDGDALTATVTAGPAHGTFGTTADGGWVYTADAGFTGTDSLHFALSDGVASSEGVLTFNVTNSAPYAYNNSFSVAHDHVLTEPSWAGLAHQGYDMDGDPLTATVVTGPAHGTFVNAADGGWVYTADAGFVGTDSLRFVLSDGIASSEATLSFNVTNSAPYAYNNTFAVAHDHVLIEPSWAGLAHQGYDMDGDFLTATVTAGPAHGTFANTADGGWVYTADTGFVGTDGLRFTLSDGVASSSEAAITINVTNTAPYGYGQWYTAPAGAALSVNAGSGLLMGVYDADGDALTVALAAEGAPAHGTVVVSADGSFVYTPQAGYVGADAFSYTVSDGVAVLNATATINLTEQAPVAQDDFYTLSHGRTLTIAADNGVLGNDTGGNGAPLTAAVVMGPSHGSLTLNADGSLAYTPSVAGYVGTDTFSYQTSDGVGTSYGATVTLDITNEAPQGSPPAYSVVEDDVLTVSAADGVLASARDGDDDAVTAELLTGTAHGTLTFHADGSFEYDAPQGYAGPDSFTYRPTDGITPGDAVTVSIRVDLAATSGTDPRAVVRADMNGDGIADVVVADAATGLVSVYLVNGAGAIATTPFSQTQVGTEPAALAAGDFNHDGKSDLAVANAGSNTVSVLLNNGNATFAVTTVSVGVAPKSLAVGDFDGDGDADLAVANSGSNSVSILLGNGDGTFTAAAEVSAWAPDAVAVGDATGDGVADVVVLNPGLHSVTILGGNGDGTFQATAPDPAQPAPNSLVSVASVDFQGGVAITASERTGLMARIDEVLSPYVYAIGSKLKVAARFTANPALAGNVRIKAEVDDAARNIFLGEIQQDNVNLANGFTATSTWQISDEVTYYDKLKIRWSYSINGVDWVSMGETERRVYVTYRLPDAAFFNANRPLLLTFVDLGCRAAEGESDPTRIFNAIWARFQSRDIRRSSDNAILYYYGNTADVTDPPATGLNSSVALVRTRNGQCHAFAELFMSVLYGQGLPNPGGVVFITVLPVNNKQTRLLLKGWTGNNGDVIMGGANPGVARNRRSTGRWLHLQLDDSDSDVEPRKCPPRTKSNSAAHRLSQSRHC